MQNRHNTTRASLQHRLLLLSLHQHGLHHVFQQCVYYQLSGDVSVTKALIMNLQYSVTCMNRSVNQGIGVDMAVPDSLATYNL